MSRPAALAFWERTADDRSVLDLVREWRSDGAGESVAMVGALAAARLGLSVEANALLTDAVLADAKTRDSAQALLTAFLESAESSR